MSGLGPGRRASRLLAIGYQGFANLGDEAILTGIEALLGETQTVAAVICGPRPESVAAFPEARRISAPRLLPNGPALRSLWRSDALVLTGGGLIHDHWASIIPRYLGWIVLARLFGKRVVWLGVGVGPIRRRSHRLLARLARRLTTLALVRDAASAALVGGASARVGVVPDPALYNGPVIGERRRRHEELAIIVRGPTPAHADDAERLAAIFADAYLVAAGRGWRPVLMTMAGPADEPFVARITRHLAGRGEQAQAEPLGPTPRAAIERLASVDAAISVRLHGLLLASVAGVPCVPVAYDAKVEAAAGELGIGDMVVDPAVMTPELLLDRLDDARSTERRRGVAERMDEIRRGMPEVAQRVADALEGGR